MNANAPRFNLTQSTTPSTAHSPRFAMPSPAPAVEMLRPHPRLARAPRRHTATRALPPLRASCALDRRLGRRPRHRLADDPAPPRSLARAPQRRERRHSEREQAASRRTPTLPILPRAPIPSPPRVSPHQVTYEPRLSQHAGWPIAPRCRYRALNPGAPLMTMTQPSSWVGEQPPPPTPSSSPTSTRPAIPRRRSRSPRRRSSSSACSATATPPSSPSWTRWFARNRTPTKPPPSKPSSPTRHRFTTNRRHRMNPHAQHFSPPEHLPSLSPFRLRSRKAPTASPRRVQTLLNPTALRRPRPTRPLRIRLQNLLLSSVSAAERCQRDPHRPAQHARTWTKLYLVSSRNAIELSAPPDQQALAQKIICRSRPRPEDLPSHLHARRIRRRQAHRHPALRHRRRRRDSAPSSNRATRFPS